MEDKEKYCYKWDTDLVLSKPNFASILNTQLYDDTEASKAAFPSDYTLAKFAGQAYNDKNYLLPKDWQLLTTATNSAWTNGYFGAAFWNPRLCQVVVAHRGTKPSSLGALFTDAKLALSEEKMPQAQSAATFVHLVSEAIKVQNSASGPRLHMSITGHSLGAWLAQITTFTVKYFQEKQGKFVEDKKYIYNIHAHTVVFESPGCKEALEKLVKKFVPRYVRRKYGNYDTLDMTVYLSKLNPINSVNRHVGTIFIVPSQSHSLQNTLNLFNPVTGSIEREQVLDFRSGIFASTRILFKKLVPFSSADKPRVSKIPVNENEYSLNVFNEQELDFVTDWVDVVKHDSLNVRQFEIQHSLPYFDIDCEYNVIKSNYLNKTIACIKRLQPTKTVIFELLKSDSHDRVYYEIFRLETTHFQRQLVKFCSYYFKDKYGLKKFLESQHQILHIRVDSTSTLEYELETSILNSVLTYYKKTEPLLSESYFKEGQYGFLTWNKLDEVLKFVPDLFEKYKINLLIVECFDDDSEDVEQDILQFLHKIKVKLIILSLNVYSWKSDELSIEEVCGFGSSIKFQDLTENSQKEFMLQQNLILHGRKMSLSDIINADFPFNNEVYEHLNRAFPGRALLDLMLTPTNESIVMDCPYSNLLKSVIFLDVYCEVNDIAECLRYRDDKTLFIIQDDENCGLSQNDLSVLNETEREDIKIQFAVDFEKECFENSDKMIYSFVVQNGKVFLTKIFNKNFYIPRNVILEKRISPLIFSCSTELTVYYFCGDQVKFEEYMSDVSTEYKNKFRFVKSEEQAKQRIQSEKLMAHLLKIEDEQIIWLYSHGDMSCLRRYVEPHGGSTKEAEIISSEDTAILSGEPGIGKSSTIGYLYLNLQQKYWVFAVPLKHCKFDNLSIKIDFPFAVNFILRTCGIADSNFIKHLLCYCLKRKTNLSVFLMFDGYDEIPEKEVRETFISLINFLKTSSEAKILITTRKYRSKQLENGISVLASNFEPFNSEIETVDFFRTIWHSKLRLFQTNISTGELTQFAKNMLKSAEKLFGETVCNFIGIPLQMRMIAEVVTPKSSEKQFMFTDALELYKKYIRVHYDIYFQRYNISVNEATKKWFSRSISEQLYKLAVTKLFAVIVGDIGHNDIEELNKVGLIQSNPYNNFNCEFLHDSVRDYFIAYLLKLWLKPSLNLYHTGWDIENFIVSDFLLHETYREVRFFLNCYLKEVAISDQQLIVCQNKLKELWESKQNIFFNENQESIFHICVKENLCFLLKYFLLPLSTKIDKVKLLSQRNSNLQTPLFIAITMINSSTSDNTLSIFLEKFQHWSLDDVKAILLATLFVYFRSDEHTDILQKYSKGNLKFQKIVQQIKGNFAYIDEFLNACKFNNVGKVSSILQRFQNDTVTRKYLLLSSNECKETGLHLTTSTEIADKLLKLHAEKNLQDHHGMTPLARAIKRGTTETATRLIEKGADTSIGDSLRNSPLIHAAKYGNLQVAKLILGAKNETKVSIEDCNVFKITALMTASKNGHAHLVKYLLDKGANVAAKDWNGMTPVFHAVKGDHTHFIRILKEKGADINEADDNCVTPLMYAVRKCRWRTVISLLDNGADVNIGDASGTYPLQLLIKMDQKGVVKKILESSMKSADNCSTVRTDMLSKEEQMYINNVCTAKEKKTKQ